MSKERAGMEIDVETRIGRRKGSNAPERNKFPDFSLSHTFSGSCLAAFFFHTLLLLPPGHFLLSLNPTFLATGTQEID